jgi:hypothetical protein
MAHERTNRYARRSQARTMPRDRRLHYHVRDAIFPTHQQAREYAATIAAEIRGEQARDGVLVYITTVQSVIDAQLQIVSCDQRGCI